VPPENIRFTVQLPPWYDRKLRLWAKLKGTARATLMANVVQARIEANWADVERDIEAISTQRGITRQDLEAEWLNGGEDAE
jgi:hypothetical protein